ncbi:MAG: hypothetical protein AAGI70_08390, partial [Pseudomonadota bacterium]
MRLILPFGIILAVVAAALVAQASFPWLTLWAVEQQRAFQNEMAQAVHALRRAEPGALMALMAAAGAYGFVHAVGPGHGKYLIDGVGLGSQVSPVRLVSIGFAASLAQALWAITLVYGGLWLVAVSAQRLTIIAEEVLAPVSYMAIGAIGAVLVWRGARALGQVLEARALVPAHAHAHGHGHHHHHDHHHSHDHHHHHDAECGCGGHHLNPSDVAGVTSLRDAVALVLSVAVRPCTGAVLLLIISWQLDMLVAGAAAAFAMGLGTGALVSLVAVSSIAVRRVAQITSNGAGVTTIAAPCLQVL